MVRGLDREEQVTDRRFTDPEVKAVFDRYPAALQAPLLALRRLIFEAAAETEAVGEIIETLKWGQPAYLPATAGVGTTIRIDVAKGDRQYPKSPPPQDWAMYFHCQTTLLATFRRLYSGELAFQGNRAIVFSPGRPVPRDAVKHCIALALTYHLPPPPLRRSVVRKGRIAGGPAAPARAATTRAPRR
jgi:hypothetical protein